MRLALGVVAVLCLGAASPPGWFPGAGLLVFVGLGAFYAVLTSCRRPYLVAYAVGLGHVLAFSWSVRHVVWPGYVAAGVVGAVYYAAIVLWLRGLDRWMPRSLAFGLALAGTQALRAWMPEIPYPHGQPIHGLVEWLLLLGPVAWGGEVLGNALYAAWSAAVVDLYRAWHHAQPAWPRGRRTLLGLTAAALAMALIGPPRHPSAAADPVRIVAVQPNLAPGYQFDANVRAALERALLEPTARLAGRRAAAPPDLVLWPETSYQNELDARGDTLRWTRRWSVPLAPPTRLVAGTVELRDGGVRVPIAVLVDARGRLAGSQPKRRLVPAGEYVPFLSWLPEALRERVVAGIRDSMQEAPAFSPGEARDLLATAAGVPFGTLLCYDNAFPEVARSDVARGARFLVVLSNESWYRGGNELAQLEAMTVCRAVELGVPIVRCTVDGSSVAVDADGVVVERLPYGVGADAPGVLEVEIRPGPGALPPLAWLHPVVWWIVVGSGLAIAWHVLGSWARLPGIRRDRGGDSRRSQSLDGDPQAVRIRG